MSLDRLGQHELLDRLGQGAMGVVWKARDERSGELVALKLLNETSGGRRFRREFRAARRLEHPNVVRVFEMGTDSLDGTERSWFTMELVEGATLRELLDREAAGWPPERHSPEWLASRLSLLHQVALGLQHCHDHGVLHRDLKPTNVLVGEDGLVRLVDFGLARMDGRASSLSGAGQLIGTVAYMSPEQARGGALDARSDVHGLGALAHELACGQPPFRGEDLPSVLMDVLFHPAPDLLALDSELDPELASLAAACLAKDPLERPQSAGEVAARVRALAAARGLELDGRSADPSSPRVRALAPQPVGREAEREALNEALERAGRGAPRVVTVTGPSGVGKSRLAEEIRVDAELRGFQVLASAASVSPRPLGALREALRAAVRGRTDDDARLLTTVLPELLGSGDDRGEAAPADRLRVAWAAEAVLARLLARGPHLLVLDDLQWADALSVQVIERLLATAEAPLLVLAFFRDDEEEPRPAAERLREALEARGDGVRLRMDPLDEAGVARMVESMLGRPPSAQVAAEIRQATGGRPHDVEQVVRELTARGAVRVTGDELSLTLPESVKLSELTGSEAVRSHLEALGEAARRILLTVLLAGSGVHVTTLREALGLEEDELLDELERLVTEGLLRDGPGVDVVSLAHGRLREAFSVGSSADELGSLRGTLARALEERGDAHHRVAELDLAASALDDAVRTVPVSAEAFAAAGLHAPALERYEALLALAENEGAKAPPETYKRHAELLAQAGRTEESVEAYAALIDEPAVHALLPPWSAMRQMAFSLMLLTRNEEARELLERSVAGAREAGDASGLVRGLSVLGTIVDRLGDWTRSREHHEEAVQVARDRAEKLDLAMALNNLGVFAYRQGRLDEATACYREAAPLFEDIGDAVHAANCKSGLAAVLLARGEPEACRPIAREALAEMRRTVDVRGLSRVLEVIGLASLELGEVDEAESCLDEALAIRGRLQEPWAQAETALNLAACAAFRCCWDRAEELLERARGLFETAADATRRPLLAARGADLAWRARRLNARALADEAVRSLAEGETPKARAELQLVLGRLAVDEGRPGEAAQHLQEGLEAARGLDSPELAHSLEAELLLARSKTGDGEGLEEEAARLGARALRRPVAARLQDLLTCAAVLRRVGSDERAAERLGEAERLLARLRTGLPGSQAEAFAGQHAHARLLAFASETGSEDDMSSADREELERLRTFHALVMASDPSEPDTLLANFVSGALERLGFARGLVFVAADGELSCRAARDASGGEVPAAERRVSDQLLRHALDKREPVLSLRVSEDPEVEFEGSVAELGVQAYAAVPVTAPGGLRVVAYFDGPPPARDVRESLRRLAPVFEDFGLLLERSQRVRAQARRAEELLSSLGGGEGPIVGSSRAVEDLRGLIRTVAPTDASVLVLGENGTGKELVARELHSRSHRKDAPMLARSCAELTETLLESELFGHEKGAFTGASKDRAGLFESATGGTLFLDEVGEMSPGLQAKLLRVLETGEVTRIGSSSTRKVDVRVVAATHRDLAAEVQEGSFRQDLYYRLKVIELRVPALRERRDDIPLLAHHFLALASTRRERAPRGFTHEALRALARHDWPGNVRELRNVVERALILGGDREEIGLDLLPPEVLGEAAAAAPGDGPAVTGTDLRAARDSFEKACIERALEENAGNRTHAAKALGISVRSLQQKMGRYGVS